MRVGIVCPYSFDVPGGVQWHVRDLAEYLIGQGHDISVLAPATDDTPVPEYVSSAGRAVPIRYNGSTARLTFGPRSAARVNRWLQAGDFDLIHIHEPITPSLSLLALWATEGPVVATFHTSTLKSRAMQAARPLVGPSLEKIGGRIAVSADALDTLRRHLGSDAVIIPNAVFVDRLAAARPRPEWVGSPAAPTLAFLGRFEEPRKGLQVLLKAMPQILAAVPGTRLFVAGRGDQDDARETMTDETSRACTFLGVVSDADKAALLASADLYIAPQTGGESFGVVLVEAMSVGTPVVASDIPPFADVLLDGEAGTLFRVRDPADLAGRVLARLRRPVDAQRLAGVARQRATDFDWAIVGQHILEVYELALGAHQAAALVPRMGAAAWREAFYPARADKA